MAIGPLRADAQGDAAAENPRRATDFAASSHSPLRGIAGFHALIRQLSKSKSSSFSAA